ncbi:MAG: hypothetical protein LQ351_002378, partial [Letrouitia transgressa]
CNGKRPVCARCAGRHLECHYVTENEGETPSAALKRAYASLQKDHNDLKELLDVLKSTTQEKSTEMLSNLRTGSTPSTMLLAMREASAGSQQPPGPQSTHFTLESSQSSLDFTFTSPYRTLSPSLPWCEDFPETPWSMVGLPQLLVSWV